MRYVIINILKLKIATGIHQTNNVYFGNYKKSTETATYVRQVHQAKMFDTEQEAWFYLYNIYGLDYSQRNFMVSCVRDKAIENSRKNSEEVNYG